MKDNTEGHFRIMIYLMLVFFFMDYGADALFAIGITARKIGGDHALEAFKACFFVAMGIFRGMSPESRQTAIQNVMTPTEQPKQ